MVLALPTRRSICGLLTHMQVCRPGGVYGTLPRASLAGDNTYQYDPNTLIITPCAQSA
jgi:hypothetical protein